MSEPHDIDPTTGNCRACGVTREMFDDRIRDPEVCLGWNHEDRIRALGALSSELLGWGLRTSPEGMRRYRKMISKEALAAHLDFLEQHVMDSNRRDDERVHRKFADARARIE